MTTEVSAPSTDTVATEAQAAEVTSMPPVQSQAFACKLDGVLERALHTAEDAGRPLALQPPKPKVTRVCAMVIVDDAVDGLLTVSALRRASGVVMVVLPHEKEVKRDRVWATRWRFIPPRYDSTHRQLLSMPSINPIYKVRCTCECGHSYTEFIDSLTIQSNRHGGRALCPKCKKQVTVTKMRTQCLAGDSAKQAPDIDDVLADNPHGRDIISSLCDMDRAGFNEHAPLLLPGLWARYVKAPVAFTPSDPLSCRITQLAKSKQAEVVPFDLTIKYHSQANVNDLVPVQMLMMESVGGLGWTSMERLVGKRPARWQQKWSWAPPVANPQLRNNRDPRQGFLL